MKYFALFLLILICSASLFAQTPSPTPVGEVKEQWQFFAPPGEGFTLDVPGEITPGYVNTLEENPTKARFYMTIVGGVYYYMFSDSLEKPYQNQMVSMFVDSQAPGLKPNEIYSFSDNFGYHHKVLVLKNEERTYTFQTVSLTKTDSSTRRFFEGIRVKNNLQRPAERTAIQNLTSIPAPDNSPVSIYCPERAASPPPSNTPAANSNGIGSGVSQAPNAAPGAMENVKVLSKPRANYTDYARFYRIQGSTMVRATFLANSQMGSVTAANRLPFGLTEQSLQAACGLTFVPALKNGIPYTVTKLVIYNFTLY